MNIVTFPGLNLKFELDRVAFKIFRIDIYWYSLLIVISIIIGLILAKRKEGMYGIKFDNILEGISITIPVSIIFARLYYVIFNLDDYTNIWNMFNIRNGGIAIYGCIIGGVICLFVYSIINKLNLLDLLDYIIPYVALGQSIGRWGNFINIESYGSKYTGIFRMGIIENGQYIEVHPTFLYESIITLILFITLIMCQKRRKYSGEILIVYLIIYSFFRAFIEELRVDSLMVGNIRISKALSICIFIFSFSIYIINLLRNKILKKEVSYEKI
ncbi:MAG: prolipoprotein diacylglyceryl transferase [Clostridiales bacterium]|nr:prolipoprotein diacylglyceryl transferase [Clostridiales bacterium]